MRMLIRYLFLLTIFSLITTALQAQSPRGTLTVSFTVEPSSTIRMMPDGRLDVYVANPPANNDARPIYFPPASAAPKPASSVSKGEPKVVEVPKEKRSAQ